MYATRYKGWHTKNLFFTRILQKRHCNYKLLKTVSRVETFENAMNLDTPLSSGIAEYTLCPWPADSFSKYKTRDTPNKGA